VTNRLRPFFEKDAGPRLLGLMKFHQASLESACELFSRFRQTDHSPDHFDRRRDLRERALIGRQHRGSSPNQLLSNLRLHIGEGDHKIRRAGHDLGSVHAFEPTDARTRLEPALIGERTHGDDTTPRAQPGANVRSFRAEANNPLRTGDGH
jgi:hypothetical protein